MQTNTLNRTKRYISELKKIEENDNQDISKKGDLVIILAPRQLYIPFVDRVEEHGGHVSHRQFQKSEVDPLMNTVAKIVGFDFNINYYSPWEGEVELLCADKKIRGLDKLWGQGRDFVFIPHKSLIENFFEYLQYLPGLSSKLTSPKQLAKTKQSIEAYFTN